MAKQKWNSAWQSLGKWNGMRIRIRVWERRDTFSEPPSCELWIDDDLMVPFESGRLPESLARLVPTPWGRAGVNEWVPFIRRALMVGKHRLASLAA